jgi:hypothetical protein
MSKEDNLFLESLIRQTTLSLKGTVTGNKVNEMGEPAYTQDMSDVDDLIDQGKKATLDYVPLTRPERPAGRPPMMALHKAMQELKDEYDMKLGELEAIKAKMARLVQLNPNLAES